jgi:beta-lactamase class A
MKENLILSEKIKKIIEEIRPKSAEISFAVINLKTPEPEIAGYTMDAFIYPASVYKVFIGAEVLRQIFEKIYSLDDLIEIKAPNDVDKNYKLFPNGKRGDHRPLLKAGEKVTIDYLLDLVFTRSDNTAANTLLDIVDRENINEHIILPNGWKGSGVIRKFLDRAKEDEKYRYSDTTVSCARHLVELFYKIETGQLVNEWVSNKLKEYMQRWNRSGKTGLYISEFESWYRKSGTAYNTLEMSDLRNYYRKGGWLEVNGYKVDFWKAVKNAWKKGHAINRWSNDVGVVTGEHSHYAVALLTLTKSKWPWTKFPMKKFSRKIHQVMEGV